MGDINSRPPRARPPSRRPGTASSASRHAFRQFLRPPLIAASHASGWSRNSSGTAT